MSDVAIQVENLSKRYRIGTKEVQHDTLMSAVMSWMRSPLNNFRRLRRLSAFQNGDEADVLWVLRDVSFTVKHGEVIGIIGRNGAGKSTLLKILSRITPPTGGKITLHGRVASLLEVGTGFHPELTGRENVYLNGTVLGMTKSEVDRKFGEIVEFSGVEKFIDTPVKRYSSGMKVRLAFSVAAYLEPEILLIDEVLAVGDAEFQKKCLGKMGEVAGQGRTVVFVSHNMLAIESLCSRGVWLSNGLIMCDGDTDFVVRQYLGTVNKESKLSITTNSRFIDQAAILSGTNAPTSTVKMGEMFQVKVRLRLDVQSPKMAIYICNNMGVRIFTLSSDLQLGNYLASYIAKGTSVICSIPRLPLMPGHYYVDLAIACGSGEMEELEQVLWFEVVDGDFYGTGRSPKAKHGLTAVESIWTFKS